MGVLIGKTIWGFPRIKGTFLGVPIIRIIVFGGLYWGSPYVGKLPYIYIYVCVYVGVLKTWGQQAPQRHAGFSGDFRGHLY